METVAKAEKDLMTRVNVHITSKALSVVRIDIELASLLIISTDEEEA